MSNIRLMKELKVIKGSPEMFIDVDDNNMKTFEVMFFGPPDSCFENGVFVFEFNMPDNYPFDVPKVKFITGGLINARIHPNLYKEGKVCLSILNTWGSNEWSPLLTIEKIILTIKGLLDNNPIAHEPSFEKSKDKGYSIYSQYYSLKSIYSTYNYYKEKPFGDIIKRYIKDHIKEINLKIEELSVHHNKSYQTIHHGNSIIDVYSLRKIMELI